MKHRRLATMLLAGACLVLFVVGIPRQTVCVDEPWLGEYALRFAQTGTVHTHLFGDYLGYEDHLLVYQKLHILSGAAVIKAFGFNLIPLRVFAALASAIALTLLQREKTAPFVVVLLVLLLCPEFFAYARTYRAEALETAFGVASYAALMTSLRKGRPGLAALSGALAGLAAFTHPNGVIFLGAGGLVLVVERQWRALACFVPAGLATASLFFWDVRDWTLFADQFRRDPALDTEDFSPLNWLLWPLREHKRYFRNAQVAGIATLFVLSLLTRSRDSFRADARRLIYTGALIAGLGFVAQRALHYTHYLLPLFPFLALEIARAIHERKGVGRLVKTMGGAALCVYAAVGVYHAVDYSLFAPYPPRPGMNATIGDRLKPGSTVIAPATFLPAEAERFTVKTFYTLRKKVVRRGDPWNVDALFPLARAEGADYVILGDTDLEHYYGHKLTAPPPRDTRPYQLLFQSDGLNVYGLDGKRDAP